MSEKYVEIVKEYFHLNDLEKEPGKHDDSIPSFAYKKAVETRDSKTQDWENLLDQIGKQKEVSFLRDMSFSSDHSFEATISLEKKGQTGIVFYLSFLGDFIGVYFIDYNHTSSGIRAIDGRVFEFLSFSAQNRKQMKSLSNLLREISFLFPSFKLFDNTYARKVFRNFFGTNGFYKEITLFEIFFSPHFHGIV
jgi:hypothetical protein